MSAQKLPSFAQLAAQFQTVNVGTLLWLRKSKTNTTGLAPIHLRIFIGTDRIERSTNLRVAPEQWDAEAGRIKGKGAAVAKQNQQLQLLKAHVAELVTLMKATGRKVTIKSLRQQLAAPTVGKSPCYLELCQQASESRDKSKPSTRAVAVNALRAVADWNGRDKHNGTPNPLPLDEFTPRRAAEFYHWLLRERKVTASTARTYTGTLTGLFRYAAELGEVEIGDNPFRALRRQKSEPAAPRLHLTRAQIEQLRTAENLPRAEALARDVYLTQYYLHGSRVGAVLLLRWEDVGLGVVRLQMEKGGASKQVALCGPLREVLNRQDSRSGDLVFSGLLGHDFASQDTHAQHAARKKAISSLNQALLRLAVRLGIEGRLHTHTARHTLAAHAAELGGLDVAQGMLGHTSSAMTAHYAGPQHNPALQAVEAALYEGGETGAGKVVPMWKGGEAA